MPREFGRWTATGPVIHAGLSATSAGQRPAIFSESGFSVSDLRAYSSRGNFAELSLHRFHDSSGAYEAFTFLRSADMVPSDLAPAAAVGKNRALLQAGNLVLEVSGLAAMSPADVHELSRGIEAAALKMPLPPIREYLPVPHRVPDSERYALGPAAFRAAAEALERPAFSGLADVAGFSAGAEAMLARYRKGRDEAVILLLTYPTPQSAARFERHIQLALASTPQPTESAIRRKGSLLSIVLQPPSHEYAEALLDAVSYETGITWNEPTHSLTDPTWPVIIVNTIVGTGVFLVAAIVFGIAFGGVRVITKIFLPGKVFDRAGKMEILQLGLNSKPIDARDFYSSAGF